MNKDKLTRWFYTTPDKIDNQIANGTINAWDVVISRDGGENKIILVTNELKKETIANNTSKLNKVYESMSDALQDLVSSDDIYEGEIVSVLIDNAYVPYTVNVRYDWDYYLEPISGGFYEDLVNKPSIEGVTLSGNKTFSDLGFQPLTNQELEEMLI